VGAADHTVVFITFSSSSVINLLVYSCHKLCAFSRVRGLFFSRTMYVKQLSRSRARRMEWGKGWKGSTIVLTVLKCTEH
jgi:hypothetical protein